MDTLLKSIIPYPFIFNEIFEDGYTLPQLGECKKCKNYNCLNISNFSNSKFECPSGLTCILLNFKNNNLILNNLILWPDNKSITGKKRKLYKKYVVTDNDIEVLSIQLKSIENYIIKTSNNRVKDSISFLHDIRTSVGVVLAWSQEIIDKQDGNTFEEKHQCADIETKNLLNSINLLQEQLSLADIIANPKSIKYGNMYRSKIHGFIHKIIKLFEPLAQKKSITITLRGNTDAEVLLYNSFQFVPLILMDNAIKYSFSNKEIRIDLIEKETDIELTVSSYGKIVPPEYHTKIFDKYVRGPNVQSDYPHGMGMGLYLAKLTAEAHDTLIFYNCKIDSNTNGNNSFSIKLRKC